VWKNVPRYLREEIISNLKLILSDWMANSGKNRWGFGYKVMLSGTYLYTDGNIDFTIFDYLKWGYTGDRWTYYGFIGGFIDPLIKYTLNKEGSRIYLVGAGFSFHNFNLMPALGIPYDDLKKGRYQLGVTFGYNIPLSEIVK
jgi:hypothetical protein